MSVATVGRWGKNLAVRFPNEIANEIALHEGEMVDIVPEDGHVVIRRIQPRYDLATLFAGISPAESRAAYAGTFDWGNDVGREMIEE